MTKIVTRVLRLRIMQLTNQLSSKRNTQPRALTLIISGGKSNLIVSGGGGGVFPKKFFKFFFKNSKAKLILCLSCDFCNIWMNTFDLIGILKKLNCIGGVGQICPEQYCQVYKKIFYFILFYSSLALV